MKHALGLASYLENHLVLNKNLQLLHLLSGNGSMLKLLLLLRQLAVHLLLDSKSLIDESDGGVEVGARLDLGYDQAERVHDLSADDALS